jgi:hypothetical protein
MHFVVLTCRPACNVYAAGMWLDQRSSFTHRNLWQPQGAICFLYHTLHRKSMPQGLDENVLGLHVTDHQLVAPHKINNLLLLWFFCKSFISFNFFLIPAYTIYCGPRYYSRYSGWLRAGWSGDRILVGGEIFRTCPDRPCGPPCLLYNGFWIFPGAWRWPLTPF